MIVTSTAVDGASRREKVGATLAATELELGLMNSFVLIELETTKLVMGSNLYVPSPIDAKSNKEATRECECERKKI